ncbi:MAG: hypothetical protein M1530_04055 [Candidatus Marsarchaeota archaeon]|nr:hypothetical protein [Candidatus Marsarchaeota archaeon]
MQSETDGQGKIYLVYDFEELCGVFSSLSNARRAVAEHLALIRKYTEEKSRRLGFGEVTFEVFQDQGERRWIYAMLARTKKDGADLHRRKVVIYEYRQDQYYSSMKRLAGQQTGLLGPGKKA